jgi:pimeloyl-ACP methyl ester carboxylesterase
MAKSLSVVNSVLVVLIALAVAAGCGPREQSARGTSGVKTETTATGRYATVNGLKMYYEIHGTGKPLVMLHGALSTIEVDFGKILPAFAKNRRVIAIEQQAHGHTADIDRPLTYEQMAKDTAELLRQLKIMNADFFGYSMGGAIAMQIAMQEPGFVRKLVFAGGVAYHPDGLYPQVLAFEKIMEPKHLAGSPFEKAYARSAPNPDHWPRLIAKIRNLDLNWKGWPPEAIKAIKAPMLLVIGDGDIVRPEHVAQMFRLLGGGGPADLTGLPPSQFAVLPGTTHITLVDRRDWLVSMTTAFLDAPMPKAK